MAAATLLASPALATSITIPYTFTAGTTIVSTQVNANFSTIAGVVNGNLDNSNLSASANISLSKLNNTQSFLDLQSSGTTLALGAGQTGDTVERVGMLGNGQLVFGPGSSTAVDVGISRSAVNTIQLNNGTVGTGTAFLDFKYGTLLNTTFGLIPGGRLYLTSGSPYLDSSASGSVLYGPGTSNAIVLYNATTSSYQPITFSETSLTLSPLSASTMYDVYATYASSTSLTLSAVGWSGINTPPTRGTDAYGRLTQNGSTAALLIGSFYNNGSKQTANNASERFVSNLYNAVPEILFCTDTTASWTCSSTSPQSSNGNTTDGVGRASFVQCVAGIYHLNVQCWTQGAGGGSGMPAIGIGVNSTSVASALAAISIASPNVTTMSCSYAFVPSAGLTFLQRLQVASTTGGGATYYGTLAWFGVAAGDCNGLTTTVNN